MLKTFSMLCILTTCANCFCVLFNELNELINFL